MRRSVGGADSYTLNDLLVRNARVHGERVAFHTADAVSHREHLRRVEQLAAGLHQAGVAQGDRVAMLSKNRIECIELIGAAARLGAIVSGVNWRLSAAELSMVLASDAPRIVLVEDEFWPLLDHVRESAAFGTEHVVVDGRREGFRRVDDLYLADATAPPRPAHADDPVLLVHTAWPLCAINVVSDDGIELPIGTVGEIVVRGPSVFPGYRERPTDNAQALRGGWLHTGDTGRFDDQGRLWYSGRLAVKELIKTGGENVYPAEVEAVLRQHPDLGEVAVIGVPDPQWGEAVKAVCTVAAGATPSEAEVIDFVAARIARFKRPRIVVFVPALPKRADGSTDRERVRQLYG